MGIVLDPNKCCLSHPNEEILEEYAFHRLPEGLAAQVEEHLLICHTCQDALAETDRFVSALRAAARPAPVAVTVHWGWRLAPVFVLLSILAFVVVLKHPRAYTAPVAVSLSSLRGVNPLAPAPAGKSLELNIESPDLLSSVASGGEYRVEVVDATGGLVWKGVAAQTGGKLIARMPKSLVRGVYWVRLYDANSELLKEFGLSAK